MGFHVSQLYSPPFLRAGGEVGSEWEAISVWSPMTS